MENSFVIKESKIINSAINIIKKILDVKYKKANLNQKSNKLNKLNT